MGLIQRGQVLYLACTIKTYADIRLLALHRTRAASVLELPAVSPIGFDLDTYLASGAMGWSTNKPITLIASFTPEAGNHLQETPLSEDQSIEQLPDGRLEVKATVLETQQLLWWLLGFGDGVEVMAPQALRDTIIGKVNRLVERYADGDHESVTLPEYNPPAVVASAPPASLSTFTLPREPLLDC